MVKFSAASIVTFPAQQPTQEQSKTSYLDTGYPIRHCQYCDGVMYGHLDRITGEIVYVCEKRASESNANPHYLVLTIPVQEPKLLDRRCNLQVVK